ncbi:MULTISPECIES: SDR family NAD(P)-dependent oxidoreductase [Pseudomonas]|uniref:Uncharacterized protein n=1 Tax=Pseudomonas hunanensis TaxID=1247546 RepID=A0ACC6K2X9_9PSED|nr:MULTISPECIES: SDR family NAD(P)-dependent oxidoreductase [Pseudomonas]MBP2264191.1 hypothetical protein [Pseudomonas sp. BP8]MDR6712711.1 hypothetical protein [Pseudomonas hunanensis]HDS1738040.1 SDR family NAD(P)-dependent oxidoreductase [Pseudomonas putida]
MPISLNGKRAIVSGSTAGAGLAIAISLVEAGAEVVLNGRTQARVDEALRRVREKLPAARIIGIAADLSTEQGTQTLIERMPHTDILVNNLGIFHANPSLAAQLSAHYAEGMAQRKWGRLVFLCAGSTMLAVANRLAETLADSGLRVESLLAGPSTALKVVELALGQI